MKIIFFVAMLLLSNMAFSQKSKPEKVEEIKLPPIVIEPQVPQKPPPSVYKQWEIRAGVPNVSFWFFGLISEGDCFEWFYKEKGNSYEIVGVRDLTTRIVYWKKEHLD